jgi:hypothetical protein
MPRLGSRGCVLGLLGLLGLLGMAVPACKPDAGSGTPLGSPSAAAAGREASSPNAGVEGKSTVGTGGLARSLVAVAATNFADAQPCERTCGRIGDCLLETEGHQAEFDASRLELECLDLCVHSVEDGHPRTAFLACEQKSNGCGELLGCARSNWDALVASRTGPTVQGVTGGGNSCTDGCRWMYSCIYTGAPPGHAYLSPEQEEQQRYCESMCESMSPTDQEVYVRFGECLRSNCSPERYELCFSY